VAKVAKKAPLGIIFLTVFIDLVGFGILIPLLPFYGEQYGANPFVVTMLMATYSLVQFIFSPLWGGLSDRIGRRPVLLMTLAGLGIAHLMVGFASALWMLFAFRALAGAMAGNLAAAQAYIADVTLPEDRAKGMGIIGAAFGLGFIAGPAIGGLLAGSDPAQLNVQLPAFAAAGMSWLAAALAFFALPESLDPGLRGDGIERGGRLNHLFSSLKRPDIGLLIGFFFLQTFAFAGIEATFALWTKRRFEWGPMQIGYLFAFTGVIGALIQGGLIGRLTKKFGEVNLIKQGSIMLAVGLFGAPLVPHWGWLFVAVMLMAYGLSVLTPSINSRSSQRTANDQQGGIFGLTQSASSLARIMGPLWAGMLFSTFGPNWPFWSGAAVMLTVWALSLIRLESKILSEEDGP
jgi:DHA1 family tetracycline resistance protein-like MFS transporter